MQIMGFFVSVKVPDSMSMDDVAREIKTSVGFGNVNVTPVLIDSGEQSVSKVMIVHRDMRSHDGYATHDHSVRPDHLGVHRKEWGHDV